MLFGEDMRIEVGDPLFALLRHLQATQAIVEGSSHSYSATAPSGGSPTMVSIGIWYQAVTRASNWPEILRNFGEQFAHPAGQTALPDCNDFLTSIIWPFSIARTLA